DYSELGRPLPYYPIYNIKDNNLYGTGSVLSDRLSSNINDVLIEHGLIFGNLVQKHNLYTYASSIVTFSQYRIESLKKALSKKLISVGPYIKYAEPLYSLEELS